MKNDTFCGPKTVTFATSAQKNELFAVSIWIGNRVILFLIWRRKTFGSVDSDLTLSHSQMHLSQLVARKGKSNVRKRSLMKRTLRREGFTVFLALF